MQISQLIAMATIAMGSIAIIIKIFNKFDTSIKQAEDKFERNMNIQAKRSDKLYEMFIELVKEKKKKKSYEKN